ncbi:MAG: hypothetical protein MI807_18935 [Verrucomicrobiales bacterium]|nr:hypothetical protein [Verrucomicrobiales bacterium]
MTEMTGESTTLRNSAKKRKGWKWAFFLLFLLVFAWAYTYLGILVTAQNTTRADGIQEKYIEAAYRTAAFEKGRFDSDVSITARFTRLFPQVTDGFVSPLWPWLVSNYADAPPDQLFEKGKRLNILLSCCAFVLIGLAAANAFSFSGASALILMGGFGVILERSAYFTADALYLLLFVFAWLCALSLIRQNLLWLYGVFGTLLGLTILAKSPVWPVLAGFLITSLIRAATGAFSGRRKREKIDSLWSDANQVVGLAILATAMLLVVGPMMSYSAKEHDSALHNVTGLTLWLDTPADAARFQQAVEENGIASIPKEERPGAIPFVRENGIRTLLSRAWTGALNQFQSSMLGRKGWILLYTFFVFVVVAAIHRWAIWKQNEETWLVRGTSARWMLLFLLLTMAFSLFHAGIGDPVIESNAIIPALFLPLLLTFIWISERYRRQLQRTGFANLVNRVYLALMILPITWISFRIFDSIQNQLS